MKEELKELGLTNNEITVYTTLMKYDKLSAFSLSKKAGLDRSVTYNILSSLSMKGLVSSLEENSKKFFFVTDPENLLLDIKIKEDIASRTVKEIRKIQCKLEDKEEFVKVFEGTFGSKKLYRIFTHQNESRELLGWGGNGEMLAKYKVSMPYFAKILDKKKFSMRSLIAKGYKNLELLQSVPNVKVKFCGMGLHNASCSILGDLVAFHVYEDNPKVIVIKNKAIAEVMRDAFNELWGKS